MILDMTEQLGELLEDELFAIEEYREPEMLWILTLFPLSGFFFTLTYSHVNELFWPL